MRSDRSVLASSVYVLQTNKYVQVLAIVRDLSDNDSRTEIEHRSRGIVL